MKTPSDLFTVDGTIQAIRTVAGVQNLVEDIQKGALFTGAAAAIAGQAGMVANAAALALYDGEVVTNVALLINGQLAVGTFEWLQDLEVDDEVKLVVSQIEDGPLYIHAILRKKDQLLWTPFSIDHTRFGWIMHGVKLSGILYLSGWLFLCLLVWFSDKPFFSYDFLPDFVIGTLVIGFIGFMSTRGMSELGQQAEDIFKALGVPKFERFRIKPYSLMMDFSIRGMEDRQRTGHIFKFAEALAAHKKKFKLL